MPYVDFKSFDPLLDSSDVEPADWYLLAEIVGVLACAGPYCTGMYQSASNCAAPPLFFSPTLL